MAVQRKALARRVKPALDLTPRHLWLASLGLLEAAYRLAVRAAHCTGIRIDHALADARYAARRSEARLDGVRGRVTARISRRG
ncbi:hypothetical protein [Thermomonas sp.]|uniref:hypothetical protein n=1 Tax=Thermomonas sp. TaxID=1971895 RepID=UPI0035AF2270